ncbi:MAG: hypothetical protein K2K55_00780 [Duncaniella sp.]|nr:hypothetical protein [Duncaniella sp.]
MSDNITNITIRLADLPRLPYRVRESQLPLVRKAESSINELWNKWTHLNEFSDKTSAEVLAMVTFQFAQLYYSTLEASQSLDNVLEGIEDSFDDILNADLINTARPFGSASSAAPAAPEEDRF